MDILAEIKREREKAREKQFKQTITRLDGSRSAAKAQAIPSNAKLSREEARLSAAGSAGIEGIEKLGEGQGRRRKRRKNRGVAGREGRAEASTEF